MNELIRVAADVQGYCESRRWRFCFIGGLALQRWGEPRETIDLDLTLVTGFGGEDPFIHALLGRYDGRISGAHRADPTAPRIPRGYLDASAAAAASCAREPAMMPSMP